MLNFVQSVEYVGIIIEFKTMEKPELVDDIGHSFLTDQAYMVQTDDMDGNVPSLK